VVPADRLVAAGARLALGADSLAEIDLLGEARALELQLRLVRGERNVLDDPPGTLAARLFGAATAGGMASLGLAGGTLAPGEPADFVALDLDDPSIAGADLPARAEPVEARARGAEAFLPTVVFAAARTAIRSVLVAGEPVVIDGVTAPGRVPAARILADFRGAMARLWGAA
jgi:formimidoylglutamate deiminase